VFARRSRKFEHAPHYLEVCSPTLDKWSDFVTNNNMVIVAHPPYSQEITACDFALFSELKIKLKGRRFETSISKENRKHSSAIRKMTSTVICSV
jgi:hypothetical protein